MSTPRISVVIASRGRETRLAFALDALARQTLAATQFEVIVVRSADSLTGLLTAAPEGVDVSFLISPVAGAAAQRNLGWRSAGGELVAFTDDDCRAAPDWLERVLDQTTGRSEILQGRTEPDPDEIHLLRGFARSIRVESLDPWSPTCNIVYPREMLDRLGGFDEAFPAAWGEDTDLAQRAIEAGASQRYLPGALVWHAVHPRVLAGAISESIRRSNIHIVVARHPQLRNELRWGLFTQRSHALVVGVLIGLGLARRRPLLAALAAAPYVDEYVDRSVDRGHWTPRNIVRLIAVFIPRRVILDTVELGAMAVSSVRHRTPVL